MDRLLRERDLIEELKRFMILHDLKTLAEVRKIDHKELLLMEGFGYRQLTEVVMNASILNIELKQ